MDGRVRRVEWQEKHADVLGQVLVFYLFACKETRACTSEFSAGREHMFRVSVLLVNAIQKRHGRLD